MSINTIKTRFIQFLIRKSKNRENYSDGYHSFKELYEFRKIYNAMLFNYWAEQGLYDVHKSKNHNDGEPCFGGGWFIVCAKLPTGTISNHYAMSDWYLFRVPSFDKAQHVFDGHTSIDVLSRMQDHILKECNDHKWLFQLFRERQLSHKKLLVLAELKNNVEMRDLSLIDGNEHTSISQAETGTTVRICMVSRLGDVGINSDLKAPNYAARVDVSDLKNIRIIP